MAEKRHIIRDQAGKTITVVIERDRRLRKRARWMWQPDGSILLRIPFKLPKWQIEPLLKDMARSVHRHPQPRSRRARTDTDLQERAEHLNRICFSGAIQWRSIRWVGNMEKRLGSCTTGGPTDGDIRISERIRDWPQWVVDYVIAHELAHRIHPNHSRVFWDDLRTAYPHTEKARGFIAGVGFARGESLQEDEA